MEHVNFRRLNVNKKFFSYPPADNVKGYNIHGATLSEIELDVLTGEKQVMMWAHRISSLKYVFFWFNLCISKWEQ